MKKIFLFSVVALIAALTFMSCDSEELLLTDRNNSAKIAPIDGNPILITPPAVVTSNSLTTQQLFMAGGQERKIGSFKIQANESLELKGLYLKINNVNPLTSAPISLFNFTLKDANGNVLGLESVRFTQTSTADIVRFELPSNIQILLGTTKIFDVFATANTIYHATESGEFNITLATTFNNSGEIDDYKGLRLIKVSDGSIITNASVTNIVIGKNSCLVSSYPLVSKIADGNSLDLTTIRVANPGSTNLTVNGLEYVAFAQVANDIIKPAKVFLGSEVVASITLQASTTLIINFTTPITIAGGDSVNLKVRLDNPYVNTAPNPIAGTRVFRVTNVKYAQIFANGLSSSFGLVPTAYKTSCGLPVAEAIF